MGKDRLGIGQNADRSRRGRRFWPGNSHVVRTALSIMAICRDSGVYTSLTAPFAAAVFFCPK
jgi:hypothetical protein